MTLMTSLLVYPTVGVLLTVFLGENTSGCCSHPPFDLQEFPALLNIMTISAALLFVLLYTFVRAIWANRTYEKQY